MTEQLKRCPFCGSKAEYTSIDKEFVHCTKELMCPTENLSFCVEDWQTRPVEDELRKALAEIVELCSTGGFISTDAKFKIILNTARKALNK